MKNFVYQTLPRPPENGQTTPGWFATPRLKTIELDDLLANMFKIKIFLLLDCRTKMLISFSFNDMLLSTGV